MVLALCICVPLAWAGTAPADTSETAAAADAQGQSKAVEVIPLDEIDAIAGPIEQVAIQIFKFVPPEITIPAGTTIVWTNKDPAAHDVLITSGIEGLASQEDAPKTELVGQNERIAMRFNAPGRYDYICSIHPFMRAVVVVEQQQSGTGEAR